MAYELPSLPYAANALEPVIDAKTMEIHHGKHHAAYIAKVNAAMEGHTLPSINELIGNLDALPAEIRGAVRNNGGGHANHSLFWEIMTPGGSAPSAALSSAIDAQLGGMAGFKDAFAAAGATRFGSGWAWLCVKEGGTLCVCSTANQDNPLMGANYVECPGTPILGLDVWEHAYYLNYQNRRPDYIAAFANVIHWAKVSELYAAAIA